MVKSALVIGGGPAGLSSALGLLRSGIFVTVLEQRSEWKERVCGAFLSPEAVTHLNALGLGEEIKQSAAAPVVSAAVSLPDSPPRLIPIGRGGNRGLALPRRQLEELLLKAVRQANGRVEFGVRAGAVRKTETGWLASTGRGDSREAGLLVLADGRFSIGNPSAHKPRSGWYGWNATFENAGHRPGDLALFFYSQGYVGLLTFADGRTNVCGLSYRESGAPTLWEKILERAIREQKHLRMGLENARRVSDFHGVGPLPFSKSMRSVEGVLLAGDAAAVGDPFMGEGIGRALASGPLIEAAIKSGEENFPAAYATAWKRRYEKRLAMGRAFRWLQKRPRLFQASTHLLSRSPRAMGALTPYFHGGIFVNTPDHELLGKNLSRP